MPHNYDKPQKFLSRSYTNVLRGLCMIAIVWSHTANEFPDILEAYHMTTFLNIAMLSTGVFLFLSGYGLTLSINRSVIDNKYIVRHLKGLLLPYLVFWFLYILTGMALGNFPASNNMLTEFLSFKMPYVDSWFLRTILVLYIIYLLLAKLSKQHAGIAMTTICIFYISVLAYNEVPSYWWNTIMCFPCGILYAKVPRLQKKPTWQCLGILALTFAGVYLFFQTTIFGAILSPILFCIIFAQLSHWTSIPPKVPILTYIGINSIYMYLMEEIPIDYIKSEEAGFVIFVFGSIVITIAATYLGKSLENLITSIPIRKESEKTQNQHELS